MDAVFSSETLAHIYKRVSDCLYLVTIFFYAERTIIQFSLHNFFPSLASSYGKLVLIWGVKQSRYRPFGVAQRVAGS